MAEIIPAVFLALLILAAFATDVARMRIPNRLSASFAVIGMLVHSGFRGWQGLRFSACGLVTGFVLLLLLHVIGAAGAGDVKLFAAIGALAGPAYTVHCLVYSIIFAGAIGLAVMVFHREWLRQTVRFFRHIAVIVCLRQTEPLLRLKDHAILRFPFMYAVLPGAVAACTNRLIG
jgi:prepilin peptidase CpaA